MNFVEEKVELPPLSNIAFRGAFHILSKLRNAGHQAYIVGGAPRDILIRKYHKTVETNNTGSPQEWDIATSAPPDVVLSIFPHALKIGIRFGVVVVIRDGHRYEIATFRSDLGYVDGRHPTSVMFTNIIEDVKRRDFTINGLFLDIETKTIYDYVGGIEDIKKGIVKAIGDPMLRFKEDYLRMLRAVRFASQLNFRIDDETFKAIVKYAENISGVSAERICTELDKIMESRFPGYGFKLLKETNLMHMIFLELKNIDISKYANILDELRKDVSDIETLWAALFWGVSDRAIDIMKRLRFSNNRIKKILETIKCGKDISMLDYVSEAMQKRIIRQTQIKSAMNIIKAMEKATSRVGEGIRQAELCLQRWGEEDLFPPRLIDGNDVIACGIQRGPEVAKVLRAIEDAQLEGKIKTREDAIRFVKTWKLGKTG